MKFTTAISVGLAPVALAKVARNRHPEVKRDPSFGSFGVGGVAAVGIVNVAPIIAISPPVGVANPLLLLYTNQGGGSQNNVINPQVTVTQTVQVPQGGVATAVPGIDGAPSQTIQPGASGTFPTTGQTQTITVGGDLGRAFFPADITANVGDTLIFNFQSQNHSVTQSTFEAPCQALAGGMDSGFMANIDNSVQPAPQVAMQVMTNEPLWMFCAQGDHCSVGMVLSINANQQNTHAQFQANAIATGQLPPTAITGGQAPVNDPAALDPNLANPENNLPDPNAIINDPAIANSPATGSIATGALNGGLVMGLGSTNSDGSCNCAIQCDLGLGGGAAPPGLGIGGFGGQVSVISMNQAGAGVQALNQPVGVNSVDPLGVASIDPLGAASIDPLGAASIDPLGAASIDPLGAATIDPLAAATIDPLAAATIDPLGAAGVAPAAAGSSGLVAPDPAIVGRR